MDYHDFDLLMCEFNLFINETKEPVENVKADCCNEMDLRLLDAHYTCMNCGSIHSDKEQFVLNIFDDNGIVKYIQPYKRCIYFKQKINMINCNTMYPMNARLMYFIECNRGKQFRNINRLKKLMRQAELNKYYKYIYSIYREITGTQLVCISQRESALYCKQFMKIERYFLTNNMRKNLYSYNVILYLLMKYYNNPTYNKIILPFNKNKLRKIVTNIAVVTLNQ